MLKEATPAQREALDSLLGRRPTRGNTLTVTIESLAEAVGIEDAADIILACFGEVPNLRAQRDERQAKWEQVFVNAKDALLGDATAWTWIESLRNDGLLKRQSKSDPAVGTKLMATAAEIWKRMPFDQITLAELAADLTGDTHALDRGQPLSPLLLRGLKFRTSHDGNKSAEARRLAWDSVGVVIDRLSAPALTFNLNAAPGASLENILANFRELNQPAYLTFQIIANENPFLPLPPEMKNVYVVENPVVVEVAASKLGSRCAPLICTEGQPASAVKKLLRHLSQAGAAIHLHADFDWRGLSFVDQLLCIPGTHPWRMEEEDYSAIEGSVELTGRSIEPNWAKSLVAAMRNRGTAVYEEQTLPRLLDDLKT